MDSFSYGLRERAVSLDNEVRAPIFFRADNDEAKRRLLSFLKQEPDCAVLDTIESQLRDLVKLENPEHTLTEIEYLSEIAAKLNGKNSDEYGVWVYYPWKKVLVHLLDEEEFIKVRTIRNAYKITFEEQALLRTKKVGVIGLSVGQSVSLALAIERIAGEIRIADFDTLELSNLNRIRTGVYNLGVKKTTIVAREIAEIDPYIKVICFDEGLSKENLESFVMDNGKLDIIAEECDSVAVKLYVREYARRWQIPVVMDTSDRGMIDVERFDLDPHRPLIHGLLPENYDDMLQTREGMRALTLALLEVDKGSKPGVYSLMQLGKTITNWPQLGTDVVFGGAVLAKLIGQILIGNSVPSGRARLDIVEHYSTNLQ